MYKYEFTRSLPYHLRLWQRSTESLGSTSWFTIVISNCDRHYLSGAGWSLMLASAGLSYGPRFFATSPNSNSFSRQINLLFVSLRNVALKQTNIAFYLQIFYDVPIFLVHTDRLLRTIKGTKAAMEHTKTFVIMKRIIDYWSNTIL